MDASYRIVDEPTPSPLSHLAVNPLWPFLTTLLAGTTLGLSWFVVNAFAIGSAHKKRESIYAISGLVVSLVLFFVLGQIVMKGTLDVLYLPYARLFITVLQLLVAYVLHTSQQRSFELFELFGGAGRNGLVVVIALTFLRPSLMSFLGPWGVLFF